MKIGASTIAAMYVGGAPVSAAYLGGVQVFGGAAPAPALPESVVSAHSVARRLTPDYTGDLIRIRRSSDNAEADIGFDGTGALDETALLAHCGSGDGFVVTIYEQSGVASAVDYQQATASLQPKIVNAGTVVKKSGKVALQRTDGLQHLMAQTWATRPSSATIMDVASYPPSGGGTAVWAFANNTTNTVGAIAAQGSSLASIDANFGTPSYSKSGALITATTRGQMWDAIVLEETIILRAEGADFSAAAWGAITTQQTTNETIRGGEFWSERIIMTGTAAADISEIETAQADFYGITLAGA